MKNYMNWICLANGNDKYVGLVDSYDKTLVVTSDDGISWTISNTQSNYNFHSMVFGSNKFVAIAETIGSGRQILTSIDGKTWTIQTIPIQNNWKSITYGNNLFVVVGSSTSNNGVMTSSDGETWTIQTTPNDNTWRSVVYGGGFICGSSK